MAGKLIMIAQRTRHTRNDVDLVDQLPLNQGGLTEIVDAMSTSAAAPNY